MTHEMRKLMEAAYIEFDADFEIEENLTEADAIDPSQIKVHDMRGHSASDVYDMSQYKGVRDGDVIRTDWGAAIMYSYEPVNITHSPEGDDYSKLPEFVEGHSFETIEDGKYRDSLKVALKYNDTGYEPKTSNKFDVEIQAADGARFSKSFDSLEDFKNWFGPFEPSMDGGVVSHDGVQKAFPASAAAKSAFYDT
jgi:hypothetical protein